MIAFLLAIISEAVICEMVDAGAPAGARLAAVAGLLIPGGRCGVEPGTVAASATSN